MNQISPGLWDIDEIGNAVHCYLWEWDGGVTLVDCGTPRDGAKVLDALVQNGYPLHAINRVIVTHMDLDHTGGLPLVKKATGARVVCHAAEREFLESPRKRRMGSALMGATLALAGWLPPLRQVPVSPEELVVDGQELPEGFTVVHTPGHTPGHISLLHREDRFLIAGDALANRREKLTGPSPVFTPDMRSAQRSIWRLAKLYGNDFETIVFGHGPPVLTNGGKRVRALASRIYADET